MYMNWQRDWNGILDEMMLLLHKLSIDSSIVLRSFVRALAWAHVPAWACRLGGAGGRSGPWSGGFISGMGSFGGLGFWKLRQFVIISRKL